MTKHFMHWRFVKQRYWPVVLLTSLCSHREIRGFGEPVYDLKITIEFKWIERPFPRQPLSSKEKKRLTSLSSEKPVPGTVTPFYAWAKIAGCSSLGKYGAPKETEAKEHQILSLDAGYFVENHLGFLTAIFFCCVFFEAHPKKGP